MALQSLPTTFFSQIYGQQQSGTPVGPANKIPADVICLDLNGQPIGTLGSPQVTTSMSNALGLSGQSFIHSSGNLPLSLAGNIRILFQNPTGSGVMSNITAMAGYSSLTNAILPIMYLNPTAGLPTTKGYAANVLLGGLASKSQIYADSSTTVALSGGTALFPFQIPQGRNVYSQLSMYLSPGQSLGIAVPVLAAGTVEVSIYSNETATS